MAGFPLMTRTAESPRPIPMTVRLPNISFIVANKLAVTVQSRVSGFVTMGPTTTLRVCARISVKIGNGSCHSRWLSNVHTWLKPYVSAFFARSITRALGGVVCRTTPMSMAQRATMSSYASGRRSR